MKAALSLFALPLIAATTFAVPAVASTDTGPDAAPHAAVEYDDLNLTSKKGQDAFERRLRKAAKKVCGLDRHNTGSRQANRNARECYNQAMAKAMQRHAALVADNQLGG